MEHPRRMLTSCSTLPPLQGATLADWRSQLRGVCLHGAASVEPLL